MPGEVLLARHRERGGGRASGTIARDEGDRGGEGQGQMVGGESRGAFGGGGGSTGGGTVFFGDVQDGPHVQAGKAAFLDGRDRAVQGGGRQDCARGIFLLDVAVGLTGIAKNPATGRCRAGFFVCPGLARLDLSYFFLGGTMESLAALATRNLTTFLAGILIASPVAGLRPMRALRSTRTSLPIPGRTNTPFFFTSLTARLERESRIVRACLFVTSPASASPRTSCV